MGSDTNPCSASGDQLEVNIRCPERVGKRDAPGDRVVCPFLCPSAGINGPNAGPKIPASMPGKNGRSCAPPWFTRVLAGIRLFWAMPPEHEVAGSNPAGRTHKVKYRNSLQLCGFALQHRVCAVCAPFSSVSGVLHRLQHARGVRPLVRPPHCLRILPAGRGRHVDIRQVPVRAVRGRARGRRLLW